MALIWGGMLVLMFLGPMLGNGATRRTFKPSVLVLLGVVTVAGFLLDQAIHGRFL